MYIFIGSINTSDSHSESDYRTFLNNGIMFASFHSNGTIPTSNKKLNTVASGMLICSTISNSNLGAIPSTNNNNNNRFYLI